MDTVTATVTVVNLQTAAEVIAETVLQDRTLAPNLCRRRPWVPRQLIQSRPVLQLQNLQNARIGVSTLLTRYRSVSPCIWRPTLSPTSENKPTRRRAESGNFLKISGTVLTIRLISSVAQQDFMHVLSPSGDFMFVTPSVQELLGWSVEEVIGRPVSDLLHTDDLESYRRDLGTSMQEGQDLTLYARLRTKDDRYVLFEITGHPYYAEYNGQQNCKCFFAMGRPYPSKNQAMLDSFLELKFENERLRQELQVLYKEIEGGGGGADGDFRPAGQFKQDGLVVKHGTDPACLLLLLRCLHTGFSSNPYDSPASPMRGGSFTKNTPGSVIDPVTGLVQAGGLLPSSSNTYGALGIGISANGSSKADGTEKKKKVRAVYRLASRFRRFPFITSSLLTPFASLHFDEQKPRVEEGEFVCRDCGTVDSPEWRKVRLAPASENCDPLVQRRADSGPLLIRRVLKGQSLFATLVVRARCRCSSKRMCSDAPPLLYRSALCQTHFKGCQSGQS